MQRKTQYQYNIVYDYQLKFGRKCYLTDIDGVLYTYDNDALLIKALFDFKYPGESEVKLRSSTDVYKLIAEQNKAPLFFVLTFLDNQFPVKCFYVIPINDIAKKKIKGNQWMSLHTFSRFEHWLLGKYFIDENNLSQDVMHYDLPEINC